MKETLSSLSEKTGYSTTTISRVLNGKGEQYRISPETQKAIMDAAHKHHYLPNLTAKNLRKKKTDVIGLILPSISNRYFADIASIITEEADKEGYTTMLINYGENEENEKKGIRTILSQRVDGIIISPTGNISGLLEDISTNYCPVVLIDRYYPQSTLSYVTTNNFIGGKQAVQNLISAGHRKIACIQGVQSSMPNKKRVEGYIAAMTEAGLEDGIEVVGNDFSISNGYLETQLMLEKENRPSAIFALSNTIALGAIKAIREAGLELPEDISIVSFDDNIFLDYMTPAITRISQPIEKMAQLATKILFGNIRTGQSVSSQIELTPELIRRDSIRELPRERSVWEI